LVAEIEDAALDIEALVGLEGPGWLLWDRLWDDAIGRESILRVARAVEQERTLIGASSHLFAAARKPR